MTTELQMLAWTAGLTALFWLPYILAHVLNVGVMEALTYRADGTALPAWAARAKKAHYNAVENLVVFASLILVAHLAGVATETTATAATAYFWLRAAHYVFYISGIPFTRTLTFAGAWLALAAIFLEIVQVAPA